MSKRPWSVFVLFAVFVLVVGAACSASGGDPSPTEEPRTLPTSESEPTAELPKPALPTQGAAPVGPAPFEIDSNVYEHSSGIFSFNPPAGWSMDEGSSGVVLTSPDEKAMLDFSVTNTGVDLDMASVETFVQATEANYYSGRPDYEQVDYQIFDDGRALVKKTFQVNDIPQYVFTLYYLNGPAVYSFDFWSDMDVADSYTQPYMDLLNTINYDSSKAADLPIYNFVYTFTDQNNLFQFDVPLSWTYAYDEGENYYTDTFTSPDGNAAMENISFDDGTTFTKSDAGATALNILNKGYTGGAGDIKITGDVVQGDGSERLDWTSKEGGYSGQSFFETRGTTFLMLSLLTGEGFEEVYSPVFDNTLATYAIP